MPTSFAPRMAVFYGALFLIYGIHLPYFPAWLESRGLGVEQIAWIVAAPLFLRVALTPYLAGMADHTRTHNQWILALALISLASALVLSQLTELWQLATASLILAIAFSAMTPLAETIAVSGVRVIGLDYGRMRLWGSASFIAASFIGGALIARFGAGIIIWLIFAALILTLAAAFILPTAGSALPDNSANGSNTLDDLTTRPSPPTHNLNSKLFFVFLICAGCSQAAHATYYAFATLQWLNQGISPVWIGILWAVGVIAEIALFSYSRAIVTRTGPVLLLILGSMAGVVRWAAMAFEPPLWALFPIQLLHAMTYGATHIGAVHFIAIVIPQNRTATAQALYGAIGNGFALGVTTLLAGWLLAMWGATISYLAMAAVSLVAVIAGLIVAQTWKEPPPNTAQNP